MKNRYFPLVLLGAVHLGVTAIVEPSWCFAKYPHLADLVRTGSATGAQVGDASPGYLLLNLALSPLAVRWLQALVAAACVVALFHSLRTHAGPLAAWVAAVGLALAQPWVVYSAVLEPDLLIGAFTLGTLLLIERHPLGAGVLSGLAISLRPTGVVLLSFLVVWLLTRRTPWRSLGAFLAAALTLAALPPLILNALAAHDLRGTMSVGQVFHLSHRPESVGFGAAFPSLVKIVEAQAAAGPHPPDHAHELYREIARADRTQRLTDAETELYWLNRSLNFIRIAPGAALLQSVMKGVFFIVPASHEYDIPAVQRLFERSWLSWPLRWLTLLGCGGLMISFATRRPSLFALHWLAVLTAGLIFYSHGRYLVGLVPSLCALLGLGAAAVGSNPRLFVLAALPVLLLALPRVRWADRLVERLAVLDVGGNVKSTTWEEARQRYLDEQAAAPDVLWPTSPRGAGVGADDVETLRQAAALAATRYGKASSVDATLAASLWAAAGDCERALPLTAPAIQDGFAWSLGDLAVDPRIIASDCLLLAGRRQEAVAQLEQANSARPARLAVLARLVAAGDVGEATDVARWERELFQIHDRASAHYALARARSSWGDPFGAIRDAEWLIAHWPASTPFAEHELALALLDLGRVDEARSHVLRTLELRVSMHGERRFDALMKPLSGSADESEASLALAYWRRRGNRLEVQQLLKRFPSLRN